MGVVWRAYDELLGRDVAVKEVLWPPELSASDQQVLFRRTVREARAAARLNHPAAVTVFDVVEEHGLPWIVMEFVRSRSLAQAGSRKTGCGRRSEAARIGLEVLGALAAAHAASILHRDVKPGNVLLAEDGRVVLTDFGIAALEGDATLTAAGAVMGQPRYISPERARGGQAEPASDLWSLGVTLYAAVEGRTPHERGGAIPTLLAVATEEPDPPQRAGPLTPVLQGPPAPGPGQSAQHGRRRATASRGRRRVRRRHPAGSPAAVHPARSRQRRADAGAPAARPRVRPRQPVTSADPASGEDLRRPAGAGRPPVPAATGRDGGAEPAAPPVVALLAALAGLTVVGLVVAVLLTSRHRERPSPPPGDLAAFRDLRRNFPGVRERLLASPQ